MAEEIEEQRRKWSQAEKSKTLKVWRETVEEKATLRNLSVIQHKKEREAEVN